MSLLDCRGMSNDDASLRLAIGENARRLREAAGARQDDVARASRIYGASWTRSKIAALERGDKAVDVGGLLILAAALGSVGNEVVRLSDLLAGVGYVSLTPTFSVTRAAVARALDGEPVNFLVGDVQGGRAMATEAISSAMSRLHRISELGAGHLRSSETEGLTGSIGEAEQRAGRALGLADWEVGYLAAGLWGETLTQRRDEMVKETVRADATPASTRALRGRATRQLVDELRARLEEVSRGEH